MATRTTSDIAPTTTTTYDAAGEAVAVEDPNGNVTAYSYDGIGRQAELIQPSPSNGTATGPATYYTYDAKGNTYSVEDPNGHYTYYGYDAAGRQTTVSQPDPNNPGELLTTTTAMLVCQQISDPAKRAEPVLAEIGKTAGADKAALLPLVGRIGGPQALTIIVSAMESSDPKLYEAGLRGLCNWPDASVARQLLGLAEGAKDPMHRVWALRALVRVRADPRRREAGRAQASHAVGRPRRGPHPDPGAGGRRAERRDAPVRAALPRSARPGRGGVQGGGRSGPPPRASGPQQGRVPYRPGEGVADQQGSRGARAGPAVLAGELKGPARQERGQAPFSALKGPKNEPVPGLCEASRENFSEGCLQRVARRDRIVLLSTLRYA
ncbi:MAG: hypothetical protein ABSH20_25295 [Tepidisphaeraceae bacterium]